LELVLVFESALNFALLLAEVKVLLNRLFSCVGVGVSFLVRRLPRW
jgi:hypothetical protein